MRKIIIIMFALIACEAYGQSFKEVTSSALKAVQEKNYRQAIELYNKALDIDGENHHIYYRLSLIYYYLGDLDSSIVYCDKTLNIVPQDTNTLYQRGHCNLDKGEYQKALEDFDFVFEKSNKQNADASFNIGKCFAGLGNIEKAIENYKLTLTLQPNDAYSFYELGFCFASLQPPDKENALKYYTKAIEQDDTYYDAYLNRGLLYATQFNDSEKGHVDLERSIEIRPENKFSYMYKGFLYRNDATEGNEENLFKARSMFDKVIENYPDDADAYFERAFIWFKIGILNMVCKDLEKAESLGHAKAVEMKEEYCK